MNDAELIRALQQISVQDRHRCFGCGYEHRCSLRGCAIINAAVKRLEALSDLEFGNENQTMGAPG